MLWKFNFLYSITMTIHSGHERLFDINLKTDHVKIKLFIWSRLHNNYVVTKAKLTDEGISQIFYHLLTESPLT